MDSMARIDSLIMVMLGLAQLLIGDAIGLEFLSILLQGTGGGTIVMGIYFLIFLSRHQKASLLLRGAAPSRSTGAQCTPTP